MKVWRNIQAWWIYYDRRAGRHETNVMSENSEHTCPHCYHTYQGRYCPQCGLNCTYTQLSLKSLCLNFLDIWGMGNRPMKRTICELLWRPGYMIREYLHGHHLNYFPPFKMLIVFTFFLFLTAKFLSIYPSSEITDILAKLREIFEENQDTLKVIVPILNSLQQITQWFNENPAYNIIAQNILIVLAVWITFRKHPQAADGTIRRYTFTETFFSQIYINNQMLLLAIPYTLISRHISDDGFFVYYLPDVLVLPILILDYKQLYSIGLLRSAWLTFRMIFTLIAISLLFLIFISFSLGIYACITLTH
ncbi:MAG: DUF3667 domain-containing protein [Prevotella sp.]|nr:DUF3667 domain-containing protein [Prevotella sp.]